MTFPRWTGGNVSLFIVEKMSLLSQEKHHSNLQMVLKDFRDSAEVFKNVFLIMRLPFSQELDGGS
jgi:hypothetical protein